jgi:hypothetical protein
MNHCSQTNKVLYSERSWAYPQVLCDSLFSFIQLFNTAVVRNFEVILGQTLKTFCGELCNSEHCHTSTNDLSRYY